MNAYTYGNGRYAAVAPDPGGSRVSSMMNPGYATAGNTYAGGKYDQNGQRVDAPGQTAKSAARYAAMAFPLGGLWSSMLDTSRAGNLAQVGPYTADAFGDFRFGAPGPMGTMFSPVGQMVGPENYVWGGPAMNDYTGAYGLGTVGNTGISATPGMFDSAGYKGGAYGYGYGSKADGTYGSLTADDVGDVAGKSEAVASNPNATYNDIDDLDETEHGNEGGGSDGKVICGELNRQGLMPDDIYEGDLEYQRLHVDDATKAGYLLWARPIVRLMRKSKVITHIVKPLALPWAEEMAYRSRGIGKGNKIGALYLHTMAPVCKILGKMLFKSYLLPK